MPTETLVPIPKAVQDDLARVQGIRVTTITTATQEREAVDTLTFVATVERHLEQARKEIVGPLNDQVRRVNDRFKALLQPVHGAAQAIKDELLAWRRKETARLEAERRAQEEAARQRAEDEADRQAAQDAELRALAEAAGFAPEAPPEPIVVPAVVVPPPAPPPPATVTGAIGSATVRRVWTFELVDLAQVPPAYLQLDERRVREAMAAGITEIPGLRIFQREIVAAGRVA